MIPGIAIPKKNKSTTLSEIEVVGNHQKRWKYFYMWPIVHILAKSLKCTPYSLFTHLWGMMGYRAHFSNFQTFGYFAEERVFFHSRKITIFPMNWRNNACKRKPLLLYGDRLLHFCLMVCLCRRMKDPLGKFSLLSLYLLSLGTPKRGLNTSITQWQGTAECEKNIKMYWELVPLFLHKQHCPIHRHPDLYFGLEQVSELFEKQSCVHTWSVLSERAYAHGQTFLLPYIKDMGGKGNKGSKLKRNAQWDSLVLSGPW